MKRELPLVWDEAMAAFRPTEGFRRLCHERYGAGEIVVLAEVEARSAPSHRHYFACIREAWANLPEAFAPRFPTEEHLRKHALIKVGCFDALPIVCGSKAEAERVAAHIRASYGFAVATIEGRVVTRFDARSQAEEEMEPADFERCKQAVLGILADMIGVDPAALVAAGRKAAA